MNPPIVHRPHCDRIHLLVFHPHRAQRPRQPERSNQLRHRIARTEIGAAEGLADPFLAFGVNRFVEAQDVRQHDAGCITMWNVSGAPEHVADAMAGAFRDTVLGAHDRHPGAELAVQPCR